MPPPPLRRTLKAMPVGFDAVSRVAQFYAAKGKELVADFQANESLPVSYINRCDGLDCQIDALGSVLYGLTPAEIKIVERTDK